MRPQLATEVGDWMVTVVLILLCYIYNTAPTLQYKWLRDVQTLKNWCSAEVQFCSWNACSQWAVQSILLEADVLLRLVRGGASVT